MVTEQVGVPARQLTTLTLAWYCTYGKCVQCVPFGQQGDGRAITEMADPVNERRIDPVAVKRITPFIRPYVSPDQLPPDYLALLSLTFGVVGLMLKV